jgi:hypothetical protein
MLGLSGCYKGKLCKFADGELFLSFARIIAKSAVRARWKICEHFGNTSFP